jgi:thioredoxin 1
LERKEIQIRCGIESINAFYLIISYFRRTSMATEVNADIFEKEVVQSQVPVLVDFWGPQCAPCLALMPKVEGLAEKYAEKLKITKVDASKNRRLCLNLKVFGLPTFLFYKNGKEVDRLSGNSLKIEEIEEVVEKII